MKQLALFKSFLTVICILLLTSACGTMTVLDIAESDVPEGLWEGDSEIYVSNFQLSDPSIQNKRKSGDCPTRVASRPTGPAAKAYCAETRTYDSSRSCNVVSSTFGAGYCPADYSYQNSANAQSMREIDAIRSAGTAAQNAVLAWGQNMSLQAQKTALEIIQKYKIAREDWNGVNTLQLNASRVGSLDLGLYQKTRSIKDIYNDADQGKLKLLISFGADEIDYSHFKSTKTIYMGTHGDRGASNADIILASAAFTEKDAIYINTEGRLQYANQASFPPNESKHDWKIINQISEILNLRWGITKLQDIRDLLKAEYIELFKAPCGSKPYKKLLANKPINTSFEDPQIKKIINDFYLTDSISRFSKTMAECSQVRKDLRSSMPAHD